MERGTARIGQSNPARLKGDRFGEQAGLRNRQARPDLRRAWKTRTRTRNRHGPTPLDHSSPSVLCSLFADSPVLLVLLVTPTGEGSVPRQFLAAGCCHSVLKKVGRVLPHALIFLAAALPVERPSLHPRWRRADALQRASGYPYTSPPPGLVCPLVLVIAGELFAAGRTPMAATSPPWGTVRGTHFRLHSVPVPATGRIDSHAK